MSNETEIMRDYTERQYKQAVKRWEPMLNHPALPKIDSPHKRTVTAMLLENTEKEAFTQMEAQQTGWGMIAEDAPTNVTAGVQNFDPVLISMVRRMAPNLIAYDVCGVQPMTGPTGLIFTLRARYGGQDGVETFYNEPNAAHSAPFGGANQTAQTQVGTSPTGDETTYNSPQAIVTRRAEALGYDTTGTAGSTGDAGPFPEMSLTIDKVAVAAKSRALKAEYSIELAQDMRAIHGMDVSTELTNIMSTQILSDINREIVRMINIIARPGAQEDTNEAGEFDLDVDSNGRHDLERFKGMSFQIERECNAVAKSTRRGKGNIVLCSADVASALKEAQNLNFEPRRGMGDDSGMNVDDTGTTFAGTLNSGVRVYIDPYALANYFTVGYRGNNAYDAGLFYCPYVPLQQMKAIGENNFQPRTGFKTRYGVCENTFARGVWAVGDSHPSAASGGILASPADDAIIGRPRYIADNGGTYDFNATGRWEAAGQNVYYRLVLVNNLT